MRLKRIRRNRKAFNTMWPVVVILVSVLIMIFLLLFVKKNHEVGQSSSAQTACRSSVIAHSKFGTPINCPVSFINIKTRDKEDAKRIVADAMVDCWDDYGKGRLKLFQAEDEKFCTVCSIINFKRIDERITGFPLFLSRSYFSRVGVRYNYQEYLTGFRTSDSMIDELSRTQAEQYLDPESRYAILFTFYKDSEWDRWVVIGATIAVGVVLFAAATVATIATMGAAAPTFAVSAAIVAAMAAGGAATGAATGVIVHEQASTGVGSSLIGAEWDAGIIITLLNASNLAGLGCEELPVGLTGITDEGPEELAPEVDVRR